MAVIRGHITRHLFSNSADNYHVYEFNRKKNRYDYKNPLIKIIYHGHQPPQQGIDMAIHGRWSQSPSHCWQFTVDRYEPLSDHTERHQQNIKQLYDLLYSPAPE